MKYNEKLLETLINEANSSGEFVYITEWLGYLPYGQYQWIEIDNKEISMKTGWGKQDLEKLVELEFIIKISEENISDDKTIIKYKMKNEMENKQ
ncbi:MAG: hypothetical protein LBH44_07410 [Treponema sp.]|jgi:nicotinamidase-related amidase|nr:hypothetical protein [Treponema sp.]